MSVLFLVAEVNAYISSGVMKRSCFALFCEKKEDFPGVPVVFGSQEMFGSPFRPPLETGGKESARISTQRANGMTPSGPSELRRRRASQGEEGGEEGGVDQPDSLGEEWEVDEDGYIVEAVDTFHFRVNADELDRAMKSRRELKVAQARAGDGDVGGGNRSDVGNDSDSEDNFMMNADMLALLEGVEMEEDKLGRPIFRLEMDEDDLSKMVRRQGDGDASRTSWVGAQSEEAGMNGEVVNQGWDSGGARDFRGSVGSLEVSRQAASHVAMEGQLGLFPVPDYEKVNETADRAVAERAGAPVVGSKKQQQPQKQQKQQQHASPIMPRGGPDVCHRPLLNWAFSGVSGIETSADLVGIAAIGAALAVTVLLFDAASRVLVQRVAPGIRAILRAGVVAVVSAARRRVSKA